MTYCEFMKVTEQYWKDKLKDLKKYGSRNNTSSETNR